ncbi:MAG: hypothetical protein HY332_14450 [Chloroflexi bacterium]|nr:hypothetical protein [Chloroflexota bacterium]
MRIDTDVHEATREEVARLMVESGRVQYERLPVPDSELSELGDALLRDYFADVRRLPYPEDAEERARLLANLGFATRHTGRGTACRPRHSNAPSSTASTRAPSSATGRTWSGRCTT